MKRNLRNRMYNHQTDFDSEAMWSKITQEKSKRKPAIIWFTSIFGILLIIGSLWNKGLKEDGPILDANHQPDVAVIGQNNSSHKYSEQGDRNQISNLEQNNLGLQSKTNNTKITTNQKREQNDNRRQNVISIQENEPKRAESFLPYSIEPNNITRNSKPQKNNQTQKTIPALHISPISILHKPVFLIKKKSSQLRTLKITPYAPPLQEVNKGHAIYSKQGIIQNLRNTNYINPIIGQYHTLGYAIRKNNFEFYAELEYTIRRGLFRLEESISSSNIEDVIDKRLITAEGEVITTYTEANIPTTINYDISKLNLQKSLFINIGLGYHIALGKKFSFIPKTYLGGSFINKLEGYNFNRDTNVLIDINDDGSINKQPLLLMLKLELPLEYTISSRTSIGMHMGLATDINSISSAINTQKNQAYFGMSYLYKI